MLPIEIFLDPTTGYEKYIDSRCIKKNYEECS